MLLDSIEECYPGFRQRLRGIARGRPEGSGLLARLTAMPRLRRRLQARYERLAALMPAQIPADKGLPLAVAVPPSA